MFAVLVIAVMSSNELQGKSFLSKVNHSYNRLLALERSMRNPVYKREDYYETIFRIHDSILNRGSPSPTPLPIAPNVCGINGTHTNAYICDNLYSILYEINQTINEELDSYYYSLSNFIAALFDNRNEIIQLIPKVYKLYLQLSTGNYTGIIESTREIVNHFDPEYALIVDDVNQTVCRILSDLSEVRKSTTPISKREGTSRKRCSEKKCSIF